MSYLKKRSGRSDLNVKNQDTHHSLEDYVLSSSNLAVEGGHLQFERL